MRKIDQDHTRFRDIVRSRIKRDLKKYVSQGEMIGRQGKRAVSIPIPQIQLPKFRYGKNQKEGVGQGEGEEGEAMEGEQQPGSGMRDELPGQIRTIAWTATEVLDASAELTRRLDGIEAEALLPAVADMATQRDQLVYDGFIASVGVERLADIARYLKASLFRLDRLADTAAKDRDRMRSVHALEAEHGALMDERGLTVELEELAWALQELRVSLFAQSVGAKGQVSVKRIRSALEAIRRG